MYSNKQINVDMDTVVSFVIQCKAGECQRVKRSPSHVMLIRTMRVYRGSITLSSTLYVSCLSLLSSTL